MSLDESSLPHCSAGGKEIPGHRGAVWSCWIGVAALQGLLQCQVLSCPGEEGECQMISKSKPLVYSALQSVFSWIWKTCNLEGKKEFGRQTLICGETYIQMCVLLSHSMTIWCLLASFNSSRTLICPQDVECPLTCGGGAELSWKFVYFVWVRNTSHYFEFYAGTLVPALVFYLHWIHSSTMLPVSLLFFFCNLATTVPYSFNFSWFQPSWFSSLEYIFLTISGEPLWFTWGSAPSDSLKQSLW